MRKKSLITLGVLMNKTKKEMIKEIMLFRYSSKDAGYINPINLKFIKYITNQYKKMSKREIQIEYHFYLDRAFKKLREKRNNLLQECDWTDLPNAVLLDEKKTEWQTYRTNLRDITNGIDTVEKANNITWPTKP